MDVSATRDGCLVRDLFLRAFGLVAVLAFWSLGRQLVLLVGADGLLPAADLLDAVARRTGGGLAAWHALPTLAWFDVSDGALVGLAWAGAAAGVLLALGVLPRLMLLAIWTMYLSLVSVGSTFTSFQWDNLLLETAFFALFVAPDLRLGRRARAPSRTGRLLVLWLLVRLHVESGASKLLSGDPSWWDLSAMASYWETAPIPTALGWWAHQLPAWMQQGCSLFTFVAEFGVGLLAFGRRRARLVAFALLVALQLGIGLTANYGFFNLLSLLLGVWLLDARPGVLWRAWEPEPSRAASASAGRGGWRREAPALAAALLLVPLSTAPFLPWLADVPVIGVPAVIAADVMSPASDALAPFRTLNAYHLFASMTRRRHEIVIQGSDDGETWEDYEFADKPGDPLRAPPFVAPHQPRVDFQLWFLLLPADVSLAPDAIYFRERLSRPSNAWFSNLLERMLAAPEVTAPLFVHDPFDGRAPKWLRLQAWAYTFTDRETRARTGAWWERELLHESAPMSLRR
ncbi:MAG: lipase maturation factor family protein [Planctomycetes bacterium]|nr:lipase maturation factor family protein [Planctomycetota bacterium]